MTSKEPLTEYQRNLVETHVKLAQSIAIGFWKRAASAVDRDEIVAIAYQGLITAAQRYDPDMVPENDPDVELPPVGLSFGNYAKRRITGAIQDWLRSLDHVPRRQRRTYKDMQEQAPGRTPEETAEILGIDVGRVRAITLAVETPRVSLDQMFDQVPASENGTEGSADLAMIQDALATAIQEMEPFEKSVVVLRYYTGLSFSKIAAELGASVSTVKTTHQEAIATIHQVMLQAVTG